GVALLIPVKLLEQAASAVRAGVRRQQLGPRLHAAEPPAQRLFLAPQCLTLRPVQLAARIDARQAELVEQRAAATAGGGVEGRRDVTVAHLLGDELVKRRGELGEERAALLGVAVRPQ